MYMQDLLASKSLIIRGEVKKNKTYEPRPSQSNNSNNSTIDQNVKDSNGSSKKGEEQEVTGEFNWTPTDWESFKKSFEHFFDKGTTSIRKWDKSTDYWRSII